VPVEFIDRLAELDALKPAEGDRLMAADRGTWAREVERRDRRSAFD
jgi:hypothetical protein